jgi:signal transduction histidine kinase/ActR/RegA family two-component response regulator
LDATSGRPGGAQNGEPSLRVRTTRQQWLSSIIALCWAAFFLSNLVRGRTISTLVDVVAGVLTLACWWWTRQDPQQRLARCGHVTVGISAVALCAAASVGGLSRSVALWYLAGVPLVAGYTLGTRQAVAWTVATVGLVASVFALENVAPPPQEFLPDAPELIVGRVLFVMLLGAFSVAARRSADMHVTLLQQQEAAVKLQAAELAVARDDALGAARAKSAFLAAMSHEIRTPLNAVVGLTELLARAPLSPDDRKMVQTIDGAGRSLVRIVNDVLQFSKLEAGGARPQHAPFEVRPCVEDVITLLQPLAHDRGLTLALHVDPNVPAWVLGDTHLVRQVLVNLVSNGIKYTDEGGVELQVTANAQQLVVGVKDSGIGMDQALQSALFLPFSQLDETAARRRGGTGLGLAISKRLVDLLGGTVKVDSAAGKGSTFTVTLPFPAATAPQPAASPDATASPQRRRKTLLVEDNPGNQLVLARMLELLGCDPTVVDSGQQALDLVPGGGFDVVFMDMHMPEMDGLTATRRLCAMLPKEARPWIIGLTASVGEDQRQVCLEAGMDDFVTKPVDLKTLGETLQRAQASHRPPVA